MQKEKREAAIAANRYPIQPEQMLILCAELRAVRKLAYENTGVSNKAAALAYFDGWIESKEKGAHREIRMRDWRK
ncbi:hypothetical protein EOI67_03580 [Salmonella enterica]|nr:hypothetical protein [Salmonella enterica]EEO3564755.1 hypothetical protein [Salmonella enterica subsp. enterica serovar Poona]HBI5523280.1 hypothetical protein [Salmonella enterica subsp. enterica serovar Welikade]EAS9889808.1 hypothetical protein [Salmonella enterica]EEG2844242.1 hypothetical protein [Salmonella enterica]